MSDIVDLTGDADVDRILGLIRTVYVINGATGKEWNIVAKYVADNLMTDERITKEYDAGKAVGAEQERNRIVKMVEKIACDFFLARGMGNREYAGELASRYRDLAVRIGENT